MNGKDLAKGFIDLLRDFSEELKQWVDVFRERFRHSEYFKNKAIAKFKEDGVWPKIWGVLCYIFYIPYRIIHLLFYVSIFVYFFILHFCYLSIKYYMLGWVIIFTFIAVNLPVVFLAIFVQGFVQDLAEWSNSGREEIEQTEIDTLSERINTLSERLNILTGSASSLLINQEKVLTKLDEIARETAKRDYESRE